LGEKRERLLFLEEVVKVTIIIVVTSTAPLKNNALCPSFFFSHCYPITQSNTL